MTQEHHASVRGYHCLQATYLEEGTAISLDLSLYFRVCTGRCEVLPEECSTHFSAGRVIPLTS